MIKMKKRNLNYTKVRDQFHYTGRFRGAAHSICNLRYKIPQEIPVKFIMVQNMRIRELAEEFKGQFVECLGENTETYITFSIPIKKDVMKHLLNQ